MLALGGPREGQQAAGDLDAALGSAQHHLERLILLDHAAAQAKLGEALDAGEHIIELVRHAGGERADRGQLRCLDQPGVGALDLFEQPGVLDRDIDLDDNALDQLQVVISERRRCRRY